MTSNLTVEDLKAEKVERMHAILRPPTTLDKYLFVPTFDEMHDNYEPFLRCNHIKGKYSDVDHYLDVQFRLLREDFVRPLRKVIGEYMRAKKGGHPLHKLQDVRLYENVRIGNTCEKKVSIYNASFDVSKLRYVEWRNSMRLIFGSLLCLSSNNFQTFCFASVAGERDPRKLSKGMFQMQFEMQSLTDEFIQISPMTSFVMIESQNYFEAYRHNLLALQRFISNDFPLEEYLIRVSKEILKLSYIKENTVYDLSHMISKLNEMFAEIENRDFLNSMNRINRLDPFESKELDSYTSVKILDANKWPKAELMGFDESQYEAFKCALSKQFVLIQGPPGTGKTYVGLKIVETLLKNPNKEDNYRRFGFGSRNSKPILIVCYTNHALDQFLEGILPFCQNMVRIGGRSKSDKLVKYSLNLIRKRYWSMKIPDTRKLNRRIRRCYIEMKNIQIAISEFEKEVNNCSNDLLNIELIYDLMSDVWLERQMESLLSNYSNRFDVALIKWLAFNDFEYQEFDEELVQISDENLNDQNINALTNDNFNENDAINSATQQPIEVEADEDEVNYIIDNRMINDDFDYDSDSEFGSDEDLEFENKYMVYEKYIGFNTIFKSNSKSLESISKEEIDRLLNDMAFQLLSEDVMTREEAVIIEDVTKLSHSNRWRLYRFWVRLYIQSKTNTIERMKRMYVNQIKTLDNLKYQQNMIVIRERNVIGMTTTGAAKHRKIIESIDPQIVVIEEAAEVLESHVITSLTRSTDHLILIGDHQQLRPNPAVYELAKKFDLDVSLFERMIRNGMPFCQLKLQHRMRPTISSLIVPHIYKELEDHESVKNYENIRGFAKNMFFITHDQNESSNSETKSKLNHFEAHFIVRLCEHLILQDYNTSQITVLTMYSAQLFLIKQLLGRKHIFNGITANILDNFQGEENDIILVSFVRSNLNNDIGFLKVSNRINVALSRAKKGLYCIGNFDCLSEKCELWKNIKTHLINIEAIGPGLELYCQNHPNKKIMVSNEFDFDKFPYGGCLEPCTQKLDCGHSCPITTCHILSHSKIKCKERCLKQICELEHKCPNICHFPYECNPCLVKVEKIVPNCGHKIEENCSGNSFCYNPCPKLLDCDHKCGRKCAEECQTKCEEKIEITVEECGHKTIKACSGPSICYNPCEKLLFCGHKCELKCCEKCESQKCRKSIEKVFPQCKHQITALCFQDITQLKCYTLVTIKLKCGHNYTLQCYLSSKSDFSSVICKEKCGLQLECGHQCEGTCSNCQQSRLHVICKMKCERKLICGHNCSSICGENCPPCSRRCDNGCRHGFCRRSCSEPCIPCKKQCLWKCEHKQCNRLCYETCNRDVCERSCYKKLGCGHNCIGLCGEFCPQFCRICDRNRINELYGIEDNYEINNAKFIQLRNCKHIIELNTLKNWLSNDTNERLMKSCPQCHTTITQSQPFKYIIRRSYEERVQINNNYFGYSYDNKSKQDSINKLIDQELINIRENSFEKLKKELQNLRKQTLGNERKRLLIKSKYQLSIIENKFYIFKALNKVFGQLNSIVPKTRPLLFLRRADPINSIIKPLITHFYKRLESFIFYIGVNYINNLQQISDAKRELNFLFTFCDAIKFVINNPFNEEYLRLLSEALDSVLNFGPFTNDIKNVFLSQFNTIVETIGLEFKSEDITIEMNEWNSPNVKNNSN